MTFLKFIFIIISVSYVYGLDHTNCVPTSKQKDTSKILINLRREMQNEGIGIYIVFSDDEHSSEYTQPYDKRRDWITGFSGSAGIAVISLRTAALWTDSRYFTQAEEELDCANWLLMRTGNENVPTLISWITTEANEANWAVGITPVFTVGHWWYAANNALTSIGIQLKSVDDLVGRIWPSSERPKPSQQPIFKHDTQYAGENSLQKLLRTTFELTRFGVTATVLSALDEIAWQFNLRGNDIPYNPFFKSYAIIYAEYKTRSPKLFVNLAQLNDSLHPTGIDVLDYSTFWWHLNETVNDPTITKIWVSSQASHAILSQIPDHKLFLPLLNSPVERIKARKNKIERQGMRDCQIRDAVARMKHIGWIEQQLNDGKSINETESVDQLIFYLKQQAKFQYPSFASISASGDRAAIVHYTPKSATARLITKDKIYLLDAGSQYLDCTTDITRTHHFGVPKDLEKRAYTRVLQGVLDIADAVFPLGTYGRSIDHLGRMYLYRDGMTFGHGIGHGIGHFLSVHENPHSIAQQYSQYEEPLVDGVFISNEPGFYKPGDFGVRIEDDLEVVLANKSIYDKRQFLRFNTITLVPYETSLIDIKLLNKAQLKAINQYHAKVAKILEPLLNNDEAALKSLRSRTKRIGPEPSIKPTPKLNNQGFIYMSSSFLVNFSLILTFLLHYI